MVFGSGRGRFYNDVGLHFSAANMILAQLTSRAALFFFLDSCPSPFITFPFLILLVPSPSGSTITTFVPELLRLPGSPSTESDEEGCASKAGRAGRREDFIGEGPLPTVAPRVSRGGGALRLVRVRLVEGPGPGSARGVVFASSTSVVVAEGVVAD